MPTMRLPLVLAVVCLLGGCSAALNRRLLVDDAAAPGADCASWPPEYQTNCCNYKALLGEEDATCNEVVGSSCASWPPADQPACCAQKAILSVRDSGCNSTTALADVSCSSQPPYLVRDCCRAKYAAGIPEATCNMCLPQGECSSDFLSLPLVPYNGSAYFTAYNESTIALLASALCQLSGNYSSNGTVKYFPAIPDWLLGQVSQWRTYDPISGMTCDGQGCPVVGVIECVKNGSQPLGLDGAGNIGCGNSGTNNIGSWNSGSNVWGSCNSGSNVQGDLNSGSNIIGSLNSNSNGFMNLNQPWVWAA